VTRLVARAVLWISLLAVVAVAGVHFIYYLANWEWSRAGIAGLALTSSLVVGASLLVLGRLRRLEGRLEEVLLALQAAPAGAEDPGVTETETATPAIEPRPDFPWLAAPNATHAVGAVLLAALAWEPPDQSVFIPVFLAAGIVISALAAGVERIAALRHRGAPGASAHASSPHASSPPAREVLGRRPMTTLLALMVAGAAVAGLGVGGLYLLSHYWSQPIGPGITTMTVVVDNRGPTTTDIEVVETVGRYCTLNSGIDARFRGVQTGPGETSMLRLSPLLDEDAQNRYIGCVEDAVLEWHRLTVTATELAPR
jgi:hypothetical protein